MGSVYESDEDDRDADIDIALDPPGPSLGYLELPKNPCQSAEQQRSSTTSSLVPLTVIEEPAGEVVSEQFVEHLVRGVKLLRTNVLQEVDALSYLIQQKKPKGWLEPHEPTALSARSHKSERSEKAPEKLVDVREPPKAAVVAKKPLPKLEFGERVPEKRPDIFAEGDALAEKHDFVPLGSSQGRCSVSDLFSSEVKLSPLTTPTPVTGVESAMVIYPSALGFDSSFTLQASTTPGKYPGDKRRNGESKRRFSFHLPTFMSRASKRASAMVKGGRESYWSEYLYADDRAAKAEAKDKGVHEEFKNLEIAKTRDFSEPSRLQVFMESSAFELTMGLLILANSLLMGVELQYRTAHLLQKAPLAFVVGTHGFTAIFLTELLLRIKVFGHRRLFCGLGMTWAWLDLVVVVSALMELGSDIMEWTGAAGDDQGVAGVTQIRMARITRVVRLVRAFRVQRIIRFVTPLRALVVSIMATLKSLAWAMALLSILIYIVALIISEGCLHWYLEHAGQDLLTEGDLLEYWISIDRAMFTLFQSFTNGISWRGAAVSLEKVSPQLLWLLTLFIAFVAFALLNAMTGVFCNSAIETAQQNPDFVASSVISARKAYADNLRALFKTVDEDQSGLITLTELERLLTNERMRAHLTALEIDVSDAWTLFRLLDTNRSGSIEVEEFLQGCEHLKGHAKGIDLATLNFEIRNLGKQLFKMNSSTEEKLEVMRRQVATMNTTINSIPRP
mmetsp:Transcript_93909/g.205617  ORF Transcript_93909/g.205617 Transcript_93909/m.205617 type:complete len:732 (-) Transcript_93909:67-2262(-)